jgi:hypothetical protein
MVSKVDTMLSKLENKEADTAASWGAISDRRDIDVGAVQLGATPKERRSTPMDKCNVLDASFPSLKGVVVGVENKAYGVDFTVVVSDVTGSGPMVVRLPSGAVLTPTITKIGKDENTSGEIMALPSHYYAGGGFVRIDGAVRVEVPKQRNAPGRGGKEDLKETDVPIGTTVQLNNVFFKGNNGGLKMKGVERAYSSAKGIEILSTAPSHPLAVKELLANTLLMSDNLHMQLAAIYCDAIGTCPEGMDEMVGKDSRALAQWMREQVEKHKDARIGVGRSFEKPLFPEGTADLWTADVECLEGVADRQRGRGPLNILRCLSKRSMDGDVTGEKIAIDRSNTGSHALPLVQFPASPLHDKNSNRLSNGVSATMMCALDSNACLNTNTQLKALTEVMFLPEADKVLRGPRTAADQAPRGLSEEDVCGKSLNAFSFETPYISMMLPPVECDPLDEDDDDEGQPTLYLPRRGDGKTITFVPAVDSCRCGVFLNNIGAYDFYRAWMLYTTLSKYMFMCYMPRDYPFTSIEGVGSPLAQPVMSQTYGGTGMANIFDVGHAVRSCGVRVSSKFLEKELVDDSQCFRTPDPPLQYEQTAGLGKDAPKADPKPPKIGTHGYECLNGMVDKFSPRILSNTNLEFYVVYHACDEDVKTNSTLNTSAEAGDAHIATKFQPLTASLVNRCAVYAYDAAPSSGSKRKADAAGSP